MTTTTLLLSHDKIVDRTKTWMDVIHPIGLIEQNKLFLSKYSRSEKALNGPTKLQPV